MRILRVAPRICLDTKDIDEYQRRMVSHHQVATGHDGIGFTTQLNESNKRQKC